MISRPKNEHERCRTRGANYSLEERELLMSLVENYRCVVEDKRLNSSVAKLKQEAWELITTQFNERTVNTTRTLESLKKFYKNVKAERRRSGGVAATKTSTPKGERKPPGEHPLQKVGELRIKQEVEEGELPGAAAFQDHLGFVLDEDMAVEPPECDPPECELTILPEETMKHAALPELTISRRNYNPYNSWTNSRNLDNKPDSVIEKDVNRKIAEKRLEILELQAKLLQQELQMRKKSLSLEIELKQAQLEKIRNPT